MPTANKKYVGFFMEVNAMEWRKTEKGYNFWCEVNRKWKEYFFNNLRLIKKRNK